MTRSALLRTALAGAAGLILLGGLVGCSEDRDDGDGTSVTGTTASDGAESCAADLMACANRSSLAEVIPEEGAQASGDPIVIGMINQENTPVGSYPELSSAARAAVDFINDQLGGVDGRPLEIEVCNTEFSPEGSTACAQGFVEAGVPVVLGGIDVFGDGLVTLADNEIPFVGGIPVSTSSVTSPSSYQWSGGTWGATVAFAHHAATKAGADRVTIVYPEFDPTTDGARMGERVLKEAGVSEVQMIPYPITATDLSSPIQAAAATDPDALILLAADMGCQGAFDGVATTGVEAQVYLVGACAAPAIVDQADPESADGTIFNVEGPIDRSEDNVDFSLYAAVADEYGDGFDPVGAGTVTFRSVMNLWAAMVQLDEVTPEALTSALASKVDEPSFMGHPYTCDGEQLGDLPAMCSPHQILARLEGGELVQIGDWIDVGAVPGA